MTHLLLVLLQRRSVQLIGHLASQLQQPPCPRAALWREVIIQPFYTCSCEAKACRQHACGGGWAAEAAAADSYEERVVLIGSLAHLCACQQVKSGMLQAAHVRRLPQ